MVLHYEFTYFGENWYDQPVKSLYHLCIFQFPVISNMTAAQLLNESCGKIFENMQIIKQENGNHVTSKFTC
jgi:hypothetical protein